MRNTMRLLGKYETVAALRQADAVAFDVDSTVQSHEGIDRLAEHCGRFDEVHRLTHGAMHGSVLFEDALEQRLRLIRPTRQQFETMASAPVDLVSGVRELILRLQQQGKDVFLVSGGFRDMIAPVAKTLNIPEDHVFANKIYFDDDGNYQSFDTNEPTSKTGGKRHCIEMIKDKYNFKNIVVIGDGVTDLEARPAASAFIGFGGVQKRKIVATSSDWYVEEFSEIIEALQGSFDV